ncbi:MAG: hypothetical protein KA007_00135 [Candidatus Pacebacteria bacterium]|jgi:DNA topoisomerase IA|nr:hypothetical protein [Candidatus Paceibacterota bacterium]
MARFIIDIPTEEIKSKNLSREILDFLSKKYNIVVVNVVKEDNEGQFHTSWGGENGTSEGQELNDDKAVEVLNALMIVQEVERKNKALTDFRYE